MYQFVQNFHSVWAYLVLVFLLIAVINGLKGHFNKSEFTAKDRKIALLGLIFTHVQFLFGMILYFVSPLGKDSLGEMKNSAIRLTSMEHPLISLIAIILITIGWSKHKRQTTSGEKFKSFAIFYTAGFVLILSRLPWSQWFA